jgi:hypothetical protein
LPGASFSSAQAFLPMQCLRVVFFSALATPIVVQPPPFPPLHRVDSSSRCSDLLMEVAAHAPKKTASKT